MKKLNLTAQGKSQEIIRAYLQENASETLIEKINNGVQIEKNGSKLINKKTLNGFMKYAHSEAKKLVEKGANAACVEDEVVYGWAIHYFEEDSIEETLYNLDGSKYAPPPKKVEHKPTISIPPIPQVQQKKKEQQPSLFDLLGGNDEIAAPIENEETEDTLVEEETTEIVQENEVVENKSVVAPYYLKHMDIKKANPDSIVFTRLGDFYEAFSEDAKVLSNELGLTLTGRDVGLSERIPLVGIPYHALEVYLSKIKNNHSIVIVENIDEIKKIEKVTNEKLLVDVETGEIISDLSTDELDESTNAIEYEDMKNEITQHSLDSFDIPTMKYMCELLDFKMDIY